MYVLHAIQNNPSDLLKGLIRAHDTDGIALNKDIALRQKFNGLR